MSTIYPQVKTIKNDFVSYLLTQGVSPGTIKHYRSDIAHFLHYIFGALSNLDAQSNSTYAIFKHTSENIGKRYKNYLITNSTPQKTVNRRLATLRHFSRFLSASGHISHDIVEGVKNVQRHSSTKNRPLITQYKKHLVSSGQSRNTVKNYISDVKHLLDWAEAQK